MSNFTPEQVQEILDLYFENFAHRQYIGARYVPIFGRKGETSIEWDNSAPYEPLTIVLHEGNSYTSRQFVPTGVAITNDAYWAETGNFNAQVEQYRQEVLAIQSDIDALNAALPIADFDSTNTVKDYIDGKETSILQKINVLAGKTALILGDSTANVGGGFFGKLNSILGLTVTNSAISGTSVTPTSETPDASANDLWNITERANASTFNYDYIFLVYATNDWQNSVPPFMGNSTDATSVRSFEGALRASVDNILALNPDAYIVFVAPAYAYRNTWGSWKANMNGMGFALGTYADVASIVMNDYNMGFVNLACAGVNDSNYTEFMRNDSGGIYVHYKDNLISRLDNILAASYPWAGANEYDKGADYTEVHFPNFAYNGNLVGTLDTTNLKDKNAQYTGDRVYTFDSSNRFKDISQEKFNMKNGIYLNFFSSSSVKIYPTESPSDYVLITSGWNRCSAYLEYDGISSITVEYTTQTSERYMFDPVVSSTPFGYPVNRAMDVWYVDTLDNPYFTLSSDLFKSASAWIIKAGNLVHIALYGTVKPASVATSMQFAAQVNGWPLHALVDEVGTVICKPPATPYSSVKTGVCFFNGGQLLIQPNSAFVEDEKIIASFTYVQHVNQLARSA